MSTPSSPMPPKVIVNPISSSTSGSRFATERALIFEHAAACILCAGTDSSNELIEAHPEYAGPLYNLACCESLAGRTEDAIRHLRLAIDRKESFRSLAAEDGDFDPIRDEAALKDLVQVNAGEPTTG